MLIPAIIFVEINFHLSIGNTHSACEYEVEAEYVDDGDPWCKLVLGCGTGQPGSYQSIFLAEVHLERCDSAGEVRDAP
jgi:hypothetical protein